MYSQQRLCFSIRKLPCYEKRQYCSGYFFPSGVFAPAYTNENKPKKLSEIKSTYKVVAFGASWCPQCPKELQEISKNYATWKQHGVEVVFVSIDEDRQTFESVIKPFPFISICVYKKWESKAVKDYHVFA